MHERQPPTPTDEKLFYLRRVQDPLLGVLIGRYRLTHLLGEGGMGRVYAATHETIGSRVAIKVMSEHSGELVDRFFAEARAVNLIRHDAIVKVVDLAHLPNGRPYIVMELVEGQTLRALIRGPIALPVGGVIDAMVEVLSALGAVHAAGIVHRDLKPDNIMITPSGRVRVLDFGIAKLSGAGTATPRTQTGARLGTPQYMAPEQIRGSAVDARTDLYAAGVVLFEAVTGLRPFVADNEFELMRAHLEVAPRSVRELRSQLGPELDQVIAQALAKSPSDRFRSAAAMANALGSVRATLHADQLQPLVVHVEPAPAMAAPAPSPTVEEPTAVERPMELATVPSARSRRDQPAPSIARTTPHANRRLRTSLVVGGTISAAIVVAAIALHRGSSSDVPGDRARVMVDDHRDASSAIADAAVAPQTAYAHDYQASHFDPVAYLSRAQRLAGSIIPAPDLVMLMFEEVAPDGFIALGEPPAGSDILPRAVYQFRSRAGVADAAGATHHCVNVVVAASEALAIVDTAESCGSTRLAAPHCAIAAIWKAARLTLPRAKVFWTETGWEFDDPIEHVRRSSMKDVCSRAEPDVKRAIETPVVPAVATPADAPHGTKTLRFDSGDPRHFDALEYISTARRHARAIFPDAELVAMRLESVHANGQVDLTHRLLHGNGVDRYEFWSPSHDDNVVRAVECRVVVDVSDTTIAVTVDRPGFCHFDIAKPRCSLATVWKRAIETTKGLADVGTVEWSYDRWHVETSKVDDPESSWGREVSDDCP